MDRQRVSAPSSSYGQACTHCYKAKCRCVRAAGAEKCERCLRLKKHCEPSDSVRKRNVPPTAADASDARIARLEDKMDNFLSAMESLVGSPGASGSFTNVFQPLNGSNLPSDTTGSNVAVVTPTSTNSGSNGPAFPTEFMPTMPQTPNSMFQTHPYPAFGSANQTDERLKYFRLRMLPSFPFIDLTPEMTSGYLRQNRPVLFQAVMTVTTFSTREKLIQVEELKRLLFTSALLEVQSNIDLLLGTLVYIAWSTDAFLGRSNLISRLMMLAISLVYDLGVFKPSSPDIQVMMAITQGRADERNHSPGDDTYHGLLERQRAVLACFMLSSNISSHLGRQDAIRWTPQMDEALTFLAISESCPGDELFIAQLRLQLLKQKADDVRQQDETYLARTGVGSAPSVSRLLYLKTLRRELNDLRSSFRPDLTNLDVLHTHAQYVELCINQLSYSITHSPLPLDLSGKSSASLLGFERLECLWQSVENIKSWLEIFYRMPSAKLVGQPFHFWSQMILSITLLKYLSTLKDPDWDCQAVRNTVHLISAMDRMVEKLELSGNEPELQCDDHLLKFLSKLLARCRVWGEGRWDVMRTRDVEIRPGHNADAGTNGHSHRIPDVDEMVWMQSMDLVNEQWFEDVLGMPRISSFE